MQFNAKPIARWAVTLVCGALGVTLLMGPTPAHATVTTAVSASTHETAVLDTGHGAPAAWAVKNFNRALTVTADSTLSDCASLSSWDPAADSCYTAQISDAGTFETIFGAGTPEQGTPPNGEHITHAVPGTFQGTYQYVLYAPTADAFSASSVPLTYMANRTKPAASSLQSNDLWPAQAFTGAGNVVGAGVQVKGGAYSWTYTTQAGEQWVDSSPSDGNLVSDGNITGLQFVPPALPRLSKGHAVAVAPTREDVYFTLSGAASCVHFMIAGPGQINGHEGWVPARLGLNAGVYSGLEAGHTYLVFFTPVTSCGSQDQVPGTRTGHVTFVS